MKKKKNQCDKKNLEKVWYKQQDENIPIKNLGKEFRKKAKKLGCKKKVINKFLKDW